MRGLNNHHSTRTIAVGHAFAQNLRPGHYDLATENDIRNRLAAAFAELATSL